MQKLPPPSEFEECRTLVGYLDIKGYAYTHINNEMFTTSWRQKAKARAMGVQAGVPDYVIVLPRMVLFLEMKRVQGGTLRENQKQWIRAINDVQAPGVAAAVARGAGEAIKIIEAHAAAKK